MDKEKFFAALKDNLFVQITNKQIEGLNALLDGCVKYGITDLRMIAYILGTAYWETARTMQPIEEYRKGAGRPYGKKLKAEKKNGKNVPYSWPDKIYYGRGHTQNTWYENYAMLQKRPFAVKNGWKFLENPELLLQMEPSVWATIHCMWHGLYTGVGLRNYFNDTETDWVNARRIINGTDKAEKIADLSKAFYRALQESEDISDEENIT